MNRTLAAFTIAVALGAALALAQTTTPPASQPTTPPAGAPAKVPGPKLVVSQEQWDWGKAWEDEPQSTTITLRNDGDMKLVLSDVRSTCGCTVAQPEKRELAPGESTSLAVRFDTHGKQGDVSSKVIIESNDQARPKLEIVIKGFVKRAITREPLGGLVIRSLDGNPGQSAKVKLQNTLAEPMKLELVGNSIPEVKVDIVELNAGVAYEIVGTTTREIKPGVVRGDLTFKSGLSREKTFTLPVRVQIMSKVEAVPSAILLKPNDQAVERTVSLQYYGSGGPQAFTVTGAKSSLASVEPIIGITMPAQEWMKRMTPPITAVVDNKIKIPAASELPAGGVTVEFATSDPDVPKVEVIITTDKNVFEDRMYGRYSTAKK